MKNFIFIGLSSRLFCGYVINILHRKKDRHKKVIEIIIMIFSPFCFVMSNKILFYHYFY